jgi:hypothetical protein
VSVVATLERINDALIDRGLVVGQTQVIAVRTRLRADPGGDDAIIIKLVLADPPDNLETWPVEDLWAIREMTSAVIREVDPDGMVPWVISFESEDAGDLDTDDSAGEVQIDL